MSNPSVGGIVLVVSSGGHNALSKENRPSICLVPGMGVKGDKHAEIKSAQPNLRQVHLIASRLFAELRTDGFVISPGQMGENITTEGVSLLELPVRTQLRLGKAAVIELTGLRTTCRRLDELSPGLAKAVVARGEGGRPIYRAGVYGIVIIGGNVLPGDKIDVQLPALPHEPLGPV